MQALLQKISALNPWRRDPWEDSAAKLYASLVAQARSPKFYAEWGVTDDVDGRFDVITLHAFLVMRRLKLIAPNGQALSQALFNFMFADMDRALREMGVGDLSVGKHVKKMAQAFFGRLAAYEAGLASADAEKLDHALVRNLYRGRLVEPRYSSAMATYLRIQDEFLKSQENQNIMSGLVSFQPA